MYLPSGGGDWGCWPPGKRSLRPSAEREREDTPSLSGHGSVNTSGHMSSGLKLLSPGFEDHREAVYKEAAAG